MNFNSSGRADGISFFYFSLRKRSTPFELAWTQNCCTYQNFKQESHLSGDHLSMFYADIKNIMTKAPFTHPDLPLDPNSSRDVA